MGHTQVGISSPTDATKTAEVATSAASDTGQAALLVRTPGGFGGGGGGAVTQSGTWTVQPGNTANTTAWKVDGSAVTQPVSIASLPSGAVTNAGVFAVQATVAAPTAIYNGTKAVATAGTRVALASTQAVRSVVIKALYSNTGTIYVGNASVASTNGIELLAGDSVSLDIADLATVNLDCSVNGEGVRYIATG